MCNFTLPSWEELPELELYLDQVLLYVNQSQEKAFGRTDKAVTSAMVNNYVKHKYLAKPIKKKYSRIQLARLLVLTSLKPVFPIPDIAACIDLLLENQSSEELYNAFVRSLKGENLDQLPPLIQAASQTVQLFHQTKQLKEELEGGTSHETSPQTQP